MEGFGKARINKGRMKWSGGSVWKSLDETRELEFQTSMFESGQI